ncbi:MAG: U-box domain-containing protein [Pseudomonadota bacterium]|nr:U-box domain-containing protein [Pseudomonadota bacterium]
MPNKINIIFPVLLNNTFARATSFAVSRLLAATVSPLQICITYCVMAVVGYFIAWLWQPTLETTEQRKDNIILLRSLEKTVLLFTYLQITLFCTSVGLLSLFLLTPSPLLGAFTIISNLCLVGSFIYTIIPNGYSLNQPISVDKSNENTIKRFLFIVNTIGLSTSFIALSVTKSQVAYMTSTITAFSLILLWLWPNSNDPGPDTKNLQQEASAREKASSTRNHKRHINHAEYPAYHTPLRRLNLMNKLFDRIHAFFFKPNITVREKPKNRVQVLAMRFDKDCPPLSIPSQYREKLEYIVKKDDPDNSKIEESQICPLSLRFMTDPVELPACRVTVDRSAVIAWLATGKQHCPFTGEPLSLEMLKADIQIHKKNAEFILSLAKETKDDVVDTSNREDSNTTIFAMNYSNEEQSNRRLNSSIV